MKLATDLDRNQPYLLGLLLRFDEEQARAIEFFRKLNPSFIPPPIPQGASQSVRGQLATHSLALGIAFAAMSSQGKLMVGSKEVSIMDGAIGLSYAMFIGILLSGYLKADGVEIETIPLPNSFAEQFVYLDKTQRKELANKGLELFQDMIHHLPSYPNFQDWHDTLSQVIRIWLASTISDKRTKEADEDFRNIFSYQLSSLYAAVEHKTNEPQS